jgi:SAM-dependent methyltransferase
MPDPMKPDFFRRIDEDDDELFYTSPRLVVHIDDGAIAAVGEIYAQFLPVGGALLDIMSSWRSHIPDSVKAKLVVHNVNRHPLMPFPDQTFDGVVMTVSIQYLVRPVEVFNDIGRVLKAHAPFIVTFSNRMFPTKAVAVWQGATNQQRIGIVSRYFADSGAFEKIGVIDRSHRPGMPSDPIWAVAGYAIAR